MPNPFGYSDHSGFASGEARLVYGLGGDGNLAHISEVPSGAACGCVCPACGESLIAKRGEVRIDHFAHAGEASCGGGPETNAHAWAKNILAETLWLTLPPVIARYGGKARQLHQARTVNFHSATLEQRLGGLVPDIVLRLGARELFVEIKVTHGCGEAKIALLKSAGQAAIEIDLSAFRTSQDEAAIRAALLHDAPRNWLFNEKLDREEMALRALQEEEDRLHEQRLAGEAAALLEALVAPIDGANVLDARLNHAREIGLDLWHTPDRPALGFIVPSEVWQGAIIHRAVLQPSASPRHVVPGIFVDLAQFVVDCLHPAARRSVVPELRDELRRQKPGTPFWFDALDAFTEHLINLKVLRRVQGSAMLEVTAKALALAREADERHADVTQRMGDLERRIPDLLANVPDSEKGDFDLDAYLDEHRRRFGLSFREAAQVGGEVWLDVTRALDGIASFLRQPGLREPRDLLDLPLQRAIARIREAARQPDGNPRAAGGRAAPAGTGKAHEDKRRR